MVADFGGDFAVLGKSQGTAFRYQRPSVRKGVASRKARLDLAVALRIFGLTGGIGSGKSSVANLLRQRGVPVVSADELAREAVRPGGPGLARIVEVFGRQILDGAGGLDRSRMAELVFASEEQRAALNGIVHPLVKQLAAARFSALEQQGTVLAAYDVPLLFEVGLERQLRPVVVVTSSEQAQIERVRARDGATVEQVRARIAAQLPLAEKAARADYVLTNDGSWAELEQQVDALLSWFAGPEAA